MYKYIRVLIMAILFSLFLCGCHNENPRLEGTPTLQITTQDEAIEMPEIPMTADYNQYEFNILTSGCGGNCNDFMFEEESSLPLDNAQYKRKKKVEEDYNIQIIETAISAGSTTGSGKGFMEISTAVNSGDCNYDLALIAGYDVSTLAYNNYLYDMNSIPGVDLSKSWWDQKANEQLSVNGVMFFTNGEISVSRSDAAFCIMFNKKLTEDYQLASPYEMVKDGTWTFENFANMCKTVTEDLNQDGKMDGEDRFGLLVMDDSVVGIVNAAGERCCTIDDSGNIVLTLYNETTLAALQEYFTIAYDTQYALTYQRIQVGRDYEQYLWSGDHGLFWTSYMNMIPRFREMESDFGILPYPKLTQDQDAYYSTVFPFTSQFICVPLVQDDINRTGIITEALAYYGQKIVTPAYYDVNLIGQSTRDEESSEMLDIIFDNLVFDIGYYYQIGQYNKELIYMIRAFDTNLASRYEARRQSAEALLNIINECYHEAVATWKE